MLYSSVLNDWWMVCETTVIDIWIKFKLSSGPDLGYDRWGFHICRRGSACLPPVGLQGATPLGGAGVEAHAQKGILAILISNFGPSTHLI